MNVRPPIVVSPANDNAVVFDVLKNAVPVGTAAGVQLVAVLKSPEPGLVSHVASCACAPVAERHTVVNNIVVRVRREPPRNAVRSDLQSRQLPETPIWDDGFAPPKSSETSFIIRLDPVSIFGCETHEKP
ncbi:hypothetical protein GCM10010987_06700 [Bradyrhizobium guangdongense]|uniref:Uncharacterized protein n=1 Tax=Bradyrhizobium guangdongense TaxID=1325090 RepID=A0AA87W0J0_9BRAD|nr:hypothetical protein GCM10010987_06700 [Bradyrhizobium guangdongense]